MSYLGLPIPVPPYLSRLSIDVMHEKEFRFIEEQTFLQWIFRDSRTLYYTIVKCEHHCATCCVNQDCHAHFVFLKELRGQFKQFEVCPDCSRHVLTWRRYYCGYGVTTGVLAVKRGTPHIYHERFISLLCCQRVRVCYRRVYRFLRSSLRRVRATKKIQSWYRQHIKYLPGNTGFREAERHYYAGASGTKFVFVL